MEGENNKNDRQHWDFYLNIFESSFSIVQKRASNRELIRVIQKSKTFVFTQKVHTKQQIPHGTQFALAAVLSKTEIFRCSEHFMYDSQDSKNGFGCAQIRLVCAPLAPPPLCTADFHDKSQTTFQSLNRLLTKHLWSMGLVDQFFRP